MSQHVWRSNTLVQGVHSVGMEPLNFDGPDLGKLSLRIRNGEPVDPSELPSRFRLSDGNRDSLPDFFYKDFYFLTAKTAEVMRRHDVGNGYLHPIDVVQKHDHLEYAFILVPGNEKKAFVPDASDRIKERFPGWYSLPAVPGDDELAMSKAALEGPDIWGQWGVPGLYLSKALGDDLKASGVSRYFHLKRVRIV